MSVGHFSMGSPDDEDHYRLSSGWVASGGSDGGTFSAVREKNASSTMQPTQTMNSASSASDATTPRLAPFISTGLSQQPQQTFNDVPSRPPSSSPSRSRHGHHRQQSSDATARLGTASKRHKRGLSSRALTSFRSHGGPSSSREQAALTTQRVVQLAMDPAFPDTLTQPGRPWRALVVVLVIFGLQVASAILSAPGSGSEGESSNAGGMSFTATSDGFTAAGWATHYAGLALLAVAVLMVLIRRRPLHTERMVLVLSFLALALLVSATVLHTSRLNVSASSLWSFNDSPSSSGTPAKHIRAAQLGWLGNLFLYVCLLYLAWRSPRASVHVPSATEHDKLDALGKVRMAENLRRKVLREMQDREEEVQEQERRAAQEQAAQVAAYEARKVAARSAAAAADTPSNPVSPLGAGAESRLMYATDVENDTPSHRQQQQLMPNTDSTPQSRDGTRSQRGVVSRGQD